MKTLYRLPRRMWCVLVVSSFVVLPVAHVQADDTDVFFAVNNAQAKDSKTNIMFIMDEASSMSDTSGSFTFEPIDCGTEEDGNIKVTKSCYKYDDSKPPKSFYHNKSKKPTDKNYQCYQPDKWYFIPNADISRARDNPTCSQLYTEKYRIRVDKPIDPAVNHCDGLEEDIKLKGGRTGYFMGLYIKTRRWYGLTNEFGWHPLDIAQRASNPSFDPLQQGGLTDSTKIVALECLDDVGKHGNKSSHTNTKVYPSNVGLNENKLTQDYFKPSTSAQDKAREIGYGWVSANGSPLDFSKVYGGIYSGDYLNYLRYKTEKKEARRADMFKSALKRYILRSNNIRLGLASYKYELANGGAGDISGIDANFGSKDGGTIDVPVVDVNTVHEKWRWIPETGLASYEAKVWNERDVSHREWLWWQADQYFSGIDSTTGLTGNVKREIPGIGTRPGRGLAVGKKLNRLAGYGWRPLGETLFEVGRYFKGESPKFGAYSRPETWSPISDWGGKYTGAGKTRGFGSASSWRWRDGWGWNLTKTGDKISNTEAKRYQSPIIQDCQANAAVIFTDYTGEAKGITGFAEEQSNTWNPKKANGIRPPFADGDEGALMKTLWNNKPAGASFDCTNSINTYGTCLPEITRYLANTDLSSAVDGEQHLLTYIVHYWDDNKFSGVEPKGTKMLREAAENGKGTYIRFGSDLTELDQALGQVINLVGLNPIGSGTFVAPASSVDLSNRLQNKDEIYFSLFEPSEQDRWQGNLKRYKLKYDANKKLNIVNDCSGGNTDCNSSTVAVDANNKFKDDAYSGWSGIKDGADIKQGGAVSLLPDAKQTASRNVLTDYGVSHGGALVTLNPTLYGLDALSTDAQYAAASSSLQALATKFGEKVTLSLQNNLKLLKLFVERRVKFAQGYDKGTKADENLKYRRMGDPLHSQPKIVSYSAAGNAQGTGTIAFFGTNEGYLHAVDTSNGQEVFSFLPENAYGALGKYYDNYIATLASKVYGFDGEIEVWINDLNGDGDVQDERGNVDEVDVEETKPDGTKVTKKVKEGVYLFVGMRRGGIAYYALDVTSISAPKLMWKIERDDPPQSASAVPTNASEKFYELGQSWSKPTVIKAKFNGKEKPLLVISGGYDQSQDDSVERRPDGVGRALYVLDAKTGERKWATGYLPSANGTTNYNAFNVGKEDMKYSFPATPAVLDANGDTYVDTIIAPDSGGQIWRVDINQSNTGASDFATVDLIAKLASDKDTSRNAQRPYRDNRKFFTTPDLMVDNSGAERSLMIALGSGRRPEPLNKTVDNHLYVLRSMPAIGPKISTSTGAVEPRDIIEIGDLLDATSSTAYDSNNTNKTLTNFNKNGFYVRLGQVALKKDGNVIRGQEINVGEKVITEASIFNGYIVFSTYLPADVPLTCGEALGSNRFNAISYNNPDNRYVKELEQKGIAPRPSILILNDGDKRKPAIVVGTEVFEGDDKMPEALKNLYTQSRDKLIKFWAEEK